MFKTSKSVLAILLAFAMLAAACGGDDDGGGRDGKLAWFATEDVSWERPSAFGEAWLLDRAVYLPAVR